MGFDYRPYLDICKQAVQDDEVFNHFRRHPVYCGMLEHVDHSLGVGYISEIKKHTPYLLRELAKFAESDKLGDPYIEYFSEIDMEICPSDLRYIKVVSDLSYLFGNLNGLDIIEIGGGYGGQCKMIFDVFQPRSYTIVDEKDALDLTRKYLEAFGIQATYLEPSQVGGVDYDLFVSNYAFTEVDRVFQDLYAREVISKSKRGYITCNWFGFRKEHNALEQSDVAKLKSAGRFIPEEPLSGENNIIYLWDDYV